MLLAQIACLLGFAGVLAGQTPAARLLKQAQTDLAAGRYRSAIDQGLQAASLFRQAGDRAAQGRALNDTGRAQLYSGDYTAALRNFTDALNIARQANDFDGEITRLNNVGIVYYYQGRYAEAMDRYQEAMRRVEASPHEKSSASRRQLTTANIAILYQTIGQYERALDLYSGLLNTRQALPLEEEAQLLANIGALRRRLGDPLKALATYRSAQALYRKSAHRDGEISVLNNIGIVQAMELHDFGAAAHTFTDAERLAEQSGDRPLIVHARLYRGEAQYRSQRFAESAADFHAALDQAQTLGEKEEQWKALYGLARIAGINGESAVSNQLLTQAVQKIESLRAGLGGPALRSEFLADKRDVYDLLIQNTKNTGDSFRWMEQSRARNLNDRRPVQQRDLAAFARSIPRNTALLEYWLGPSSAAVIWISATQTGMRSWPLSALDRDAISRLPELLANHGQSEWRQTAGAIGPKLLSGIPVLQDPAIHYLEIVPDGALARIPFEALPMPGGRLLIERFAVSYLPAVAWSPQPGRPRVWLWPWQNTLEAFADPAPGTGVDNVGLEASRHWAPLPAATREAAGIAQMIGGRTSLHSGAQARKTYLYGPPPPLLHFATHAFADSQDPARSYILLAPRSNLERFDYLFLSEVYSLPLGAIELATLSACQTDAGKLTRGEGVESFSRAFLAAGARSVVTSLWNVGDRNTAELMLRFYAEMSSGKSKADALRNAKLDFLRNSASAHPAYWAAFVLNGDNQSPIPLVIGWKWLVAPLAVMGCVIILWLRRKARRVQPSRHSHRPAVPVSGQPTLR